MATAQAWGCPPTATVEGPTPLVKPQNARPVQHTPPGISGQGAAQALVGALVLVVRTDDDRTRRRSFFSLSAAERAAERARDRGHDACVVLCELVPIEVRP